MSGRRFATVLGVLATLLLSGGALFAAQQGFVRPAEREKCPVCGMFVSKYPDWTAEVLFRDGSHAVFDGPKDLFTFVQDPGRYLPGRRKEDVAALFVTDYYAVRPIDGRKALYVLGGDVYGPMGKELIPFATEADARTFLKDHGGRKVLRFRDITPQVLKELE